MHFPVKLEQGVLIRRYRRFLADILLDDGSQLTVHCPNSGSMRGCSDPGSRVAYSTADNPKRKYPQTLEMVEVGSSWVGINTSRTNYLVEEALERGIITEFGSFDTLRREVPVSDRSRLDFRLTRGAHHTYIEVKNCTLVEDGCARFPDAVTTRGTKHLTELARLAAAGHGAAVFFLVQRQDADRFEPAGAIDPTYAETLRQVARGGVRVIAYWARVTPESIEVRHSLPCVLE